MHEKSLYDLGDQQRRIVEALWEEGEATVRTVWQKLSPDKSLAYTSVLSAMQKLELAGWLRHSREGRRYSYAVTVDRSAAQRAALHKFVARVYGGDPAALLFELLSSGSQSRPMPPLDSLVQMKKEMGGREVPGGRLQGRDSEHHS